MRVGIGCALVVNELLSGRHGTAGMIDHLTTGAACVSWAGLSGLSFQDCLDRYRDGDPLAFRVFQYAGRALSILIALLVNQLSPKLVLLSGESYEI